MPHVAEHQEVTGSAYSGSPTGTLIKVKAKGPGHVYSIDALNTTGAVAYLQILDADPGTLGTTVPLVSIGIAANGKANLRFIKGIYCATGIAVAGTTTRTGSTGAQIDVNIEYD